MPTPPSPNTTKTNPLNSNITDPWQICAKQLHNEINAKDYHDWIEPLKAIITGSHGVSLSTDQPYIATVVNQRFLQLIIKTLNQYGLSLQHKRVTCGEVAMHSEVAATGISSAQGDLFSTPGMPSYAQGDASSAVIDDDLLSPDFTLEKFVHLGSNGFAYETACDIANNPKKSSHSPLVFYGPVGMGKTHLMHAIGNSLRSQFSNFKVMVFNFISFLQTYVGAVESKKMGVFRKSLKEQDVILIDDIHLIANKDKTQEQLFDLINLCVSQGHTLVFTCDQHPSHIKKLHERLRSRLIGGKLIPIDQPSEKERVQLLEKVCLRKGYHFAPGVAELVVKRSATSIRELISALDNIIGIQRHALLNSPTEDQKLLSRVHADTFLRDNLPYHLRFSADRIKSVVADYYQLDVEILRSPVRKRKVVIARHIAMELMRKFTQDSLSTIGQAFDKDHTSVIHASKRIKKEIEGQTPIAEDFYRLCRILETGDY